MNAGSITVYGNAGDAAGYAMRGGRIFIKGDAGYRCGIHMKAYKENKPVIVIGGRAGSFLGEYQAGGLIAVLGLNKENRPIVGNFCGTGMHGGEMYIRGELPAGLPEQVKAEKLTGVSDAWVRGILQDYAAAFGLDTKKLLSSVYYRLTPDTENPYHRMYTNN